MLTKALRVGVTLEETPTRGLKAERFIEIVGPRAVTQTEWENRFIERALAWTVVQADRKKLFLELEVPRTTIQAERENPDGGWMANTGKCRRTAPS